MTGADLAGTPIWAAALSAAGCQARHSDGVSSGVRWRPDPVTRAGLLETILWAFGPWTLPTKPAGRLGSLACAGDGEALLVLLAEDNPMNQRVATLLPVNQGNLVTIAKDGARRRRTVTPR